VLDSGAMSNPLGGLNVLKNWKAGGTREITERQLRSLHGSAAHDSYSGTYRLDGLVWRIVGQLSRADGETIITLQAMNE